MPTAALLALVSVALTPGVQHVARRAVVGGALSAAFGALPASANNAGALRVASGYVEPPKPGERLYDLKTNMYGPYAAALARGDWTAVGKFYLPTATLVDATTKGPVSFVAGSNVGSHLAARGLAKPSFSVGSVVLEGEQQDVAHVAYILEAEGAKPYQGLQRVVRQASGEWRVDEDVYPLENGKVYAMIQPQRDLLAGRVFMALDPKYRL